MSDIQPHDAQHCKAALTALIACNGLTSTLALAIAVQLTCRHPLQSQTASSLSSAQVLLHRFHTDCVARFASQETRNGLTFASLGIQEVEIALAEEAFQKDKAQLADLWAQRTNQFQQAVDLQVCLLPT